MVHVTGDRACVAAGPGPAEVRAIIQSGEGTNAPSGVYLNQYERACFRGGTEAAFYLHSKARAPMFRLHLTGCSDRIP
jgi:hypothetical protein